MQKNNKWKKFKKKISNICPSLFDNAYLILFKMINT